MLKDGITDRECFVDNQNLWLSGDRGGKGQPHVHATRVSLDWLMNEVTNLGKAFDLRQQTLRLPA